MELSTCDTDLDFFDDIFKDGFSSNSPDSGHDSPQSGFEAYQDDLPWESLQDDDIWNSYLQGSLLDDLPDDLSDSSTEYAAPFENNKVMVDNSHMKLDTSMKSNVELEHDYLQTVNMNEIENANIRPVDSGGSTVEEINSPLKSDVDMSVLPDDAETIPNVINNGKNSAISLSNLLQPATQTKANTTPMLLKPIAIIKGNNGILNTVQSKSQIKIGNNVFAIIQKGNSATSNFASTTKVTTLKEELAKPTRTFSLRDELAKPVRSKLCPPNLNYSTKHEDHDYIDDSDMRMYGSIGVSKGMGPGLQLTDEEKKLLELEACVIPTDMPLTKDEEKVLKKVRRKIKNKQSAMESRRRRKDYIENLERRVKHCTDQNQDLKKTVNRLTEDNKTLVNQLKQLQALVASSVQQSRSAQTGTCLAVLLFSLAFFFLPFNPLAYTNDGVQKAITAAPNARPSSFRSRTLLEVDPKHYENESNADKYSLNISNEVASDFEVNSSKLYTEEIRAEIDRLLLSDDANVRAKLNDYLQLLSENSYVSINGVHSNTVNIVEVDAEKFGSKRQVKYTDEL